jgi:FAD/FMN-containing dehydrogenase
LTASYGLGVDQVLQFKVILANGELVTANKCQYTDLFWALRGGGGGTFGVVTEVTMKVYPHMTIQAIGVDILTTVPSAQKLLMLELSRNALRWAEEGNKLYSFLFFCIQLIFLL